MKISVLGAGAIGSMIGGWLQLAAPEQEVWLFTQGEHARALAERGKICLDGIWPRTEVPIQSSMNVADLTGSDFVFLTVKSQHTEEALRTAQPYLGDAIVVSIQNGINEHVLSRYVAADRLVMGMAALSVSVLEPGIVHLMLGGPTLLGPGLNQTSGPQIDAAMRLLQRIDAPFLQFLYHPHLLGARYNKLAINSVGFASSVSNSDLITEALSCRPWVEHVGLPVMSECDQVFKAAGIKLHRIPGKPTLRGLTRSMRLMHAPLLGGSARSLARWKFQRRPFIFSPQLDIARREKTEVEYVNGEVTSLAASLGIETPCNQHIIDLTHELEARGDGTYFERDEVIHRCKSPEASVQQRHQSSAAKVITGSVARD